MLFPNNFLNKYYTHLEKQMEKPNYSFPPLMFYNNKVFLFIIIRRINLRRRDDQTPYIYRKGVTNLNIENLSN